MYYMETLDKEYMDNIQPISYKFRFTFSDQEASTELTSNEISRFKHIAKGLKDKLLAYNPTYLTGGFETLNKQGERTYAHVHFHFATLSLKDTIIKTIKRYLQDTFEQNTTGVKAFSFKPAVVRNFDDFYRYPLKQNLDSSLCFGFSNAKLETMHEVAKSSFEKVVEVNQAKMDKMDNSDTLFQKLKNIWEKNNTTEKTPLLISATKFYIDENKPLNRNVIKGYVDNYMVSKGFLSYEEYWNITD